LNPLGSRLAELIHDFEIIELASRAFDKGEQYQSEVELVENRMYLSVTATPLSPQMENGILITVHDLTGIKQTETSRKQFVSNVSHELRSPIASVKAMVEVLEDGAINENDVAVDFLQRISRDLERMTTLVDDLLELSRIESGQESFNIESLELRPVVSEAISLVRDQNRAGISFDVTLLNETTNVDVMAEKGRLIQVLVNLLQNALKFTRPVGEIKISNNQVDEFVEIHVSDTGSGISEDHAPYVFERFYKVDKSRSDQGTGLGLAIVKHLVQAHGGDVGLNSVEGEGSTFTFTLPMGR
jgi:two-component system phosphate regulon sensor histidine kinase PhoR